MKKALLIVVVAATAGNVQAQLYQQEHGLYYEHPNTVNRHDPNFFNADNQIYIPGKEFVYRYLLVKGADTLRVRVNEPADTKTAAWSFVSPNFSDSLTVEKLSFTVLPGYGGLDQLFPDYSQTVIQQKYYSCTGLLFSGATGLVENPKNVWLHPFRGKYFSVLEFSPFPYQKFPLKTGSKWSWKLENISERWSDPRIISYSGRQCATYIYQTVRKERLETRFGRLRCFVTEAKAQTSLGATSLTSWFHPAYGFVQLHYLNLDGSRLELELIEVP